MATQTARISRMIAASPAKVQASILREMILRMSYGRVSIKYIPGILSLTSLLCFIRLFLALGFAFVDCRLQRKRSAPYFPIKVYMRFKCLGIVFIDNFVDLFHELFNSNAHR